MSPAATTDLLGALRELAATARWDRPPDATLGALRCAPGDARAWAVLPWYGPLEPWLRDGRVSDVLCNGPARELYVVQDGAQRATGEAIHGGWIAWLQTQLALRSGAVDAAEPERWPGPTLEGTADGRLRFALTRPPVSPHGPTIAVRVLPARWPTLDELVRAGVLPRAAAELLVGALRAGVSLLIGGVTGSGKTTLAAALLQAIAVERRVVLIEDARELPVAPNGVALEVIRSGLSFADLVRFALRQKPQLIVVGEARGPEALAMLQGMSTGHAGITTVHSADAHSALATVERLALAAGTVPPPVIRSMLAAAAAPLVVCHIGTYGGQRRVGEIVEVLELGDSGAAGGRYPLNPLFRFDPSTQTTLPVYGVERPWGAGRW